MAKKRGGTTQIRVSDGFAEELKKAARDAGLSVVDASRVLARNQPKIEVVIEKRKKRDNGFHL